MAEYRTVCRKQELGDGESKTVVLNNKVIALFCSGGQYYAIDDMCPHAGASLAGGYAEQGIVTCPWHAWRFRLSDGAWADNPRIKIGCYSVRVEGEDIQIEVPISKSGKESSS